jgi:hypothetical protein
VKKKKLKNVHVSGLTYRFHKVVLFSHNLNFKIN